MKNIIRMTEVNERKYLLKNPRSGLRITREECERVKKGLQFGVLEYFINRISKSNIDSTNFVQEALDMIDVLQAPDSQKETLLKKVSNTVLPNVDSEMLASLNNRQAKSGYMPSYSFDVINNKINKLNIIDRILKNDESLSKRFNMDKVIQTNSDGDIDDVVKELCSLIDTYELSLEAKYNVALENITYSLHKNNIPVKKGQVINSVTDYFLENYSIMTDKDTKGIAKVLENNMIIDSDTLIYELAKPQQLFRDKMISLSKRCRDPKVGMLILEIENIKNEKQASSYINKAIGIVNKPITNNTDRRNIMTSIFLIPLLGKVSKPFVNSEMKRIEAKYDFVNKIEDNEFVTIMKDVLYDETELLTNSALMEMEISLESDLFDDSYKEHELISSFMESELIPESRDIKDILNKFKADQDKSVNRFRRCLDYIYRKSPENIIDDTPSILSVIRTVFILGTFTIPVIGPVVALITAFLDHLISSDINEKQTRKLITALDNEKELVENKLKKKNISNKEELERYLKCLEKCIQKCDTYRYSITDDEIEGRSSSDDFDDDLDFSFEAARIIGVTEMINLLTEALEDNDLHTLVEETMIANLLESKVSIPDLFDYVSLVNETEIFDIERIKRNIKLYSSSTVQERTFAIRSIDKCNELVSVTESFDNTDISDKKLFTQYLALQTIKEATKDSKATKDSNVKGKKGVTINLSTLKLIVQNFKKKAKELSVKEKSMWQSLDATMSGFMNSIERAMTSDRREAIIKGSIIPSFSKCLKIGIAVGTTAFINPIAGVITAVGIFATSKKLNDRERQLIYDEIETELKVLDKEIQIADNDGDMKKYRFLLQYQKKLQRERQRIKYGMKVHGRNIPSSGGSRED